MESRDGSPFVKVVCRRVFPDNLRPNIIAQKRNLKSEHTIIAEEMCCMRNGHDIAPDHASVHQCTAYTVTET
jgi:hypothetical protein